MAAMMRKLIAAAIAAVIALLIMPATPAHASNTGQCRNHPWVEVKVCMTANWTRTGGRTDVWYVKWTVRPTGNRSLKELGFVGWRNTHHRRLDESSGKVRREWTWDRNTATFYDRVDTRHRGQARIYSRYHVRFDKEFGGHPDAKGTLSYPVG